VDVWGNLGYVTAQALMGLLHNKAFPERTNRANVYTCFARKQMRYILGDNSAARSYVVGAACRCGQQLPGMTPALQQRT
jgi:hypothetical protein